MKLRPYQKVFLIWVALIWAGTELQASRAACGLGPAGNYPDASQEATRPRTVAESGGEAQASLALEETLKRLTAEEQAALNRPGNPHDRIKTYARLSWARLRGAREALNREEHAATSEQLEIYTALVADAGRFAAASVPPRDRAHKTLEQALRLQIQMLEGVRRDLSVTQLEAVEKALAAAHRARRQSLNLLLGAGKVLSEGPEEPSKKPPPK
jgi:hypothetical protein